MPAGEARTGRGSAPHSGEDNGRVVERVPERAIPAQNILDLHRTGKAEAAIARELSLTRSVVRWVIRKLICPVDIDL